MDRFSTLQLYVRVFESSSFTKAAQEMRIGQPAVSKQISALEARLGARLFVRSPRGLHATAAGYDFYDSAVKLLAGFEEAESRIGRGHVAPAGLVRVAAPPALARMYLVPRLPPFFAQFPDIAVEVSVSERHVDLNIMHLVFANAAHRRLLVDWDQLAPASLAMFRADSARHAGDPDFERLIAMLMKASAEFRDGWPRHEVLRPFTGHKRIKHPVGGRMTFEYTSLAVSDQPDMKPIVYTPLDEDKTAIKLQGLLRTPPSRNQTHAALEQPMSAS